MKIVRMTIILGTLALAGLAGGSDRETLHAAACSLDSVANALSGSWSGGACQR
ncbi:MAG TPA: hypothetical protein VFS20_01490 [Longimicrobium sp.]|nr:hypothetical protein [Longimicrobium sp.]